jgi:hypothetical protein
MTAARPWKIWKIPFTIIITAANMTPIPAASSDPEISGGSARCVI